jgi:glutathione S-transferase
VPATNPLGKIPALVLDDGTALYDSRVNEQSRAWIERQLSKLRRGLDAMETDLGARAWCHGERYSLADIALGCCLGWLEFRRPGGIDWREGRAHLARHYARLLERASFAETAPR